MEILILHSWKNKTFVDHLADHFSDKHNIHIENRKMNLNTINQCIVVWSKCADSIKNLQSSIKEIQKANIPIIVINLDHNKLPKFLIKEDTIDVQKPIEKQNRKGWSDNSKIIAKDILDIYYEYGQFALKNKGVRPFINQIKRKLQDAGEDLGQLSFLLTDVIQNEFKYPLQMRKLRLEIESKISSIDNLDFTIQQMTPNNQVKEYVKKIEDTSYDCRLDIQLIAQNFFDKEELQHGVNLLHHYILQSAKHLKTIHSNIYKAEQPALYIILENLVRYTSEGEDLFPNSKYGYFGYIDDAWLIHNLKYRLIETQIFPQQEPDEHWDKIMLADELIRSILPSQVIYQLEGMLLQYMQILERIKAGYEPKFNVSERNYHAFMAQTEGKHLNPHAQDQEFFKKNKLEVLDTGEKIYFGHQ